jgi:hypothetical protein
VPQPRAAINVFAQHVVRLPAAGYSTTQFDMTDEEREALVDGGRQAMRAFLAQQAGPGVSKAMGGFAVLPDTTSLANEAAGTILQR